MNRRNFFKATGLGVAIATFAETADRVERLFAARLARAPGDVKESWTVSTCGACGAGCGIRVRLVGNKVAGIRPNEENPISRGGLCAKAFAAAQSLYNPDRLGGPLMSNGEGASGRWRELSWDEALTGLSQKLASVRSGGKPVMLLTGEKDTLTARLLARFVSQLGTASVLYYPWGESGMAHPAVSASQGITAPVAYDIGNATHIFSFSSDFLQTGPSPVNLQRAFGSFRRGISRQRGRLVHFGSRLSLTASKADEWVAVKPGTEGAVALAIANTLLEEGLYDKQFVSGECTGFDDWFDEKGKRQPGFRSIVLADFNSQKVSAISGVSPEVIIKAAREFADASRPLSIGSDRIDFTYEDLVTRLAVHSLNALVGNLDRKGGVLVPRTVPLPEIMSAPALDHELFHAPQEGPEGRFSFPVSLSATDSTLDRLLAEEPPELVFVHATNPIFTSPRREEWERFFARAGFVVSFASFMDETASRANLILPDSHYLEKWHERSTWTGEGYPVLAIGRPVVGPLADTRNTGDVVLELSRRLSGGADGSFPWNKYEDVIKEQVREIHKEGRGDVFGPGFEETWVRLLERIGWRASSYPDFESFWKKCIEKGGWWDPIYYHGRRQHMYGSETGKFDLGLDLVRNRARDIGTLGSLFSLERFGERHGAEDFPFLLDVHAHYPLLEARSRNEPLLMELMTFQADQTGEWSMWVEMNPRDAEALGLRNDEDVLVETSKGKTVCRLKLFAGVPPGTVSMPGGLGRESGGRYVEQIGTNPASLVAFEIDRLTGIPLWDRTPARVTRA